MNDIEYLVLYTFDKFFTFELLTDDEYDVLCDDTSKHVEYTKKILKEGFTINMIGNVDDKYIDIHPAFWENEVTDMSDGIKRRTFYMSDDEPNLILFKTQIIEHINDIFDNWL